MTIFETFGRIAGQSFEARPALRNLFSLRRQRIALSDLTDHELSDLGLTRDKAEREARRNFWDVPTHWQK